MIFFVLSPIIFGLFFFIKKSKWLLKISLILETILVFYSVYYVVQCNIGGHVFYQSLSGISLPYGMMLKIDSLAATMILLNNVLFSTMILFNMHKPYMNKLFIFLFLSLQGLINGVFVSTDFFNVYILIEVATVVVSVLIMYKKDSQSMYDGMIYLLVNMLAMAFFLMGVGFLYKYTGALDYFSIQTAIRNPELKRALIMPFSFLMTGISLKAALMPLFSWLPKAHGTASAPSIVSGVLSGIFVKIGIYLFIRVSIMFTGIFTFAEFFMLVGFMTSIAGFVFALAQPDIKLILAYHSISQIGLMIIGLSSPIKPAYFGGMYHIVAHAIFKTLLFLISGILIEIYHTRKISDMRGLLNRSRPAAAILVIAVLSITGAPLFSGGYSKYYIMQGFSGTLSDIIFIFINMGTMMSFIKFLLILRPNPYDDLNIIKKFKIPLNSLIGLAILSSICILMGVMGDYIFRLLTTYQGNYSWQSQILKIPTYIATYSLSFAIYYLLVKESPFLKLVKRLELSFNQITLAILIFFMATSLYLHSVMG